jgi:outer membrane protein assembly factor BamB
MGRVLVAPFLGLLMALSSSAPAHAQAGAPYPGAAPGAGTMIVADDGSVLITLMGVTGTMAAVQVQRGLVDIAPDGAERWHASFDVGVPAMLATEGDLVVIALGPDQWLGSNFSQGANGARARAASIPSRLGTTIVGLDLANGNERWRVSLDGQISAPLEFSPDGSHIYVATVALNGSAQVPASPMKQGDSIGVAHANQVTVTALDRNGNMLWATSPGGAVGMQK